MRVDGRPQKFHELQAPEGYWLGMAASNVWNRSAQGSSAAAGQLLIVQRKRTLMAQSNLATDMHISCGEQRLRLSLQQR
jgi:hypothetical protein